MLIESMIEFLPDFGDCLTEIAPMWNSLWETVVRMFGDIMGF